MSAAASAPLGTPQAAVSDPIRVMVVDDAVVVRSLLSRWIGETPDLKLVAALRNGREALEQLDQTRPDVVVLDIEMPELDGISTLPKLLERRRDLVVIMASALITTRSRRRSRSFGSDLVVIMASALTRD